MVLRTVVYKQHHLGQLGDIHDCWTCQPCQRRTFFPQDGNVMKYHTPASMGFQYYPVLFQYCTVLCIRLTTDIYWYLLISTDIYWYLLIVLRLTLSDCESCAWVGRSASAWRVLPTASGHFPSQGPAHQRTLTKWPHHELNGAEVEYPWNALWNASLGTVCNTLRAWFKFHNRQYMAPHTCVLSLSLVWKQLTKHHVSPFSVHTALIKNCQYVAVVHNLSLDHYDLQAPLHSTSIPRHSTAE